MSELPEEVRTDCEHFESKKRKYDCGDCQTDGHCLCVGCARIAPFNMMECYDNREKYYPKDFRIASLEEELAAKDKEIEDKTEESELNLHLLKEANKLISKRNDIIQEQQKTIAKLKELLKEEYANLDWKEYTEKIKKEHKIEL